MSETVSKEQADERAERAAAEAFRAEQARIAGVPHKSVNGVLVELTSEQIAARAADEIANAAEAAKEPKPIALADLVKRIDSLETEVAALKAARAVK